MTMSADHPARLRAGASGKFAALVTGGDRTS
jgi:hypothetical protein